MKPASSKDSKRQTIGMARNGTAGQVQAMKTGMEVAKDMIFCSSRVVVADGVAISEASVSGEQTSGETINGMSHEASNAGTSVKMGNKTNYQKQTIENLKRALRGLQKQWSEW